MKKEKKIKKEVWMVLFVAGIMVSSVFGVIFYGFASNEEEFSYGTYKFIRKENFWSTQIDKKEYFFNYLPQELESINLSNDIVSTLSDKIEIDLTADTEDIFNETIAAVRYYMTNSLKNKNIYVRNGLTSENPYNVSVITCSTATSAVPVIYLVGSNMTSIKLKDGCVNIKAESGIQFIRIKDRLLYSILGVIG